MIKTKPINISAISNRLPITFWPRVIKTDYCWLWTGPRTHDNYGKCFFRINGKQEFYKPHRVAFVVYNGEIPEGLTIDHLCNNTLCVNPQHLQVASSKENTLRGLRAPAAINSRKTHCPRGHPFSDKNLGLYKNERYCRTCARIRALQYYYKKGKEKKT